LKRQGVLRVLNIIRNENVKIYRRVRTWIFALAVLLAVVAMALITAKVSQSDHAAKANWRQELRQENAGLTKTLHDPKTNMPNSARKQLEIQVKENQYRLDHNIPPNPQSAWNFTNNAAGLLILVTIFVAVIAADSIAGEFSSGAIKLLLIRPVNRTKILLAKYLSTLLFALAMIIELAVAAWLVGGITFGFDGISVPYIYADTAGDIHQMPMYVHVLATYGLKCINLLMIVTISFMISAIFRSSSLAIAVSLLLMFVGSTVVNLLSSYSWDKFILFANTDLTQYINGTPLVKGMTPAFSIVVLIVYFLIFHAVSWWVFTRRDVAGTG
jgi:ABC-2 type transport system permease protein